MGPRFRVWSRRIVERLERRQVAETLEAGSIVVVDEAIEEGIAVSVRDEQAVSDAAFGLATDSFDQSTIEALDHAIGLRAIGSGEAVIDLMAGADTIEGMPTGRPIMGLAFHVDGEAIGELTPIVGQDRMHWMREVSQEAFEESLRGHGITLGMDLEIDVAGGAVDGDEGIALAPLQGRKVLQIDMNKADGRLVEGADRRLIGLGALAETVPDQAAMDGAARELSIDAAVHHFSDVVERQPELGPQLANQRLLQRRQTDHQFLGRMRAVGDRVAAAPAADRGFADPQLSGQRFHRFPAALNVGPDLRCRGGVGVQAQLHDARRSLIYETPRSTPIPSNQSSGTVHAGEAQFGVHFR